MVFELNAGHSIPKPAQLLLEHLSLFTDGTLPGPILDLACGDGHNGILLAQNNLAVICCDKSRKTLARARRLAAENGVSVELWQVDLEREGINPLPEEFYSGILVFRYLHRPLIPAMKKGAEKALVSIASGILRELYQNRLFLPFF